LLPRLIAQSLLQDVEGGGAELVPHASRVRAPPAPHATEGHERVQVGHQQVQAAAGHSTGQDQRHARQLHVCQGSTGFTSIIEMIRSVFVLGSHNHLLDHRDHNNKTDCLKLIVKIFNSVTSKSCGIVQQSDSTKMFAHN